MKSVLIIEDDQTLRETVKELLELENYKVFDAANGVEGVEMAIANMPDVIICDILMPKLDGFGVFRKLNENEKTCSIPFIFLSAKSELEDVRRGMNLGADDYLTKPFKEEDLLHAIESRLAKHKILMRSANEGYANHDKEISTLDQLREYFMRKGEYTEVSRNNDVYTEKKNADYIYFVEKGLVKTHSMDEYGKELITGIYKANDFFGYYYFKNISFYPETATALSDSSLFRISSTAFRKILTESHTLAIELAQLLSDNLSALKTHLLEMAYASVLKKTTNTILHFAEIMRDKNPESIKISRSDLASVAGISTESFIRSLSSLKKEGLIDIEGRNIKILNLAKLQNTRW